MWCGVVSKWGAQSPCGAGSPQGSPRRAAGKDGLQRSPRDSSDDYFREYATSFQNRGKALISSRHGPMEARDTGMNHQRGCEAQVGTEPDHSPQHRGGRPGDAVPPTERAPHAALQGPAAAPRVLGSRQPLSGRLCFKRSEGEVAEHEAVPVLASHLRPRVPGVRPGGHLTLTPHTWTSGRIKRHRGNRCTGVTEDTSRSRAVDSR